MRANRDDRSSFARARARASETRKRSVEKERESSLRREPYFGRYRNNVRCSVHAAHRSISSPEIGERYFSRAADPQTKITLDTRKRVFRERFFGRFQRSFTTICYTQSDNRVVVTKLLFSSKWIKQNRLNTVNC